MNGDKIEFINLIDNQPIAVEDKKDIYSKVIGYNVFVNKFKQKTFSAFNNL